MTEKTGYYPRKVCEMIINACFPAECHQHVPAMPVQAVTKQSEHRDKDDVDNSIFSCSVRALLNQIIPHERVPAMVTRLLDRKVMLSKPKALEAVKKEANGLESGGTWSNDTV